MIPGHWSFATSPHNPGWFNVELFISDVQKIESSEADKFKARHLSN